MFGSEDVPDGSCFPYAVERANGPITVLRALAKKLNTVLAAFRQQVLAQISEKDGAAAVRVLRAIEQASLRSMGEDTEDGD